jgi:hypothetical protein
MDPRLRAAVDASLGWYEDLCSLHGIGSSLEDGLWTALEQPPPLHSDAVTVQPGVTAAQVDGRLGGREHAGVKDSFTELDLSGLGMRELFSATWMHHRPARAAHATSPAWTRVADADDLARWTALHDTTAVLLHALLRRGHFRILARRDQERIVGGAVARLGSGVVDVSNVWAAPGHDLDWPELLDAVTVIFPDRPLVGYERGAPLAAAVAAGFEPVGELRVWVR